jgi:small subunit ribosomal protein S20
MPLLKHAKKKQRQDAVRTVKNAKLENLVKSLIKKAKVNPTPEAVSLAFKQIDKAAKHNIYHTNKAARLKSNLSKVATSGAPVASKPTTKKSAPKKATKKAASKTTKKK